MRADTQVLAATVYVIGRSEVLFDLRLIQFTVGKACQAQPDFTVNVESRPPTGTL